MDGQGVQVGSETLLNQPASPRRAVRPRHYLARGATAVSGEGTSYGSGETLPEAAVGGRVPNGHPRNRLETANPSQKPPKTASDDR